MECDTFDTDFLLGEDARLTALVFCLERHGGMRARVSCFGGGQGPFVRTCARGFLRVCPPF